MSWNFTLIVKNQYKHDLPLTKGLVTNPNQSFVATEIK